MERHKLGRDEEIKDVICDNCKTIVYKTTWHQRDPNKKVCYVNEGKRFNGVIISWPQQAQIHETGAKEEFKHTTSSIKPKYRYIPKAALDALANRFELGEKKYAPKSWNALSNQAGLNDEGWIITRAEHIIHHAMQFIAKYKGLIKDDGDDDAAAIMWGGVCLYEAKRCKKERLQVESSESAKSTTEGKTT